MHKANESISTLCCSEPDEEMKDLIRYFSVFHKPYPINLSTILSHTVKPRPEAHMDMIPFEVFLKSIDLIPQQQILQRHYLYYR